MPGGRPRHHPRRRPEPHGGPAAGSPQRAVLVPAARRRTLLVCGMVRRRLGGRGRPHPHAGPRWHARARPWRRGSWSSPATEGRAGPSTSCATTTPSSRWHPAPRSCPFRAARRTGLPPVELAGGRGGAQLPALLRRHVARRGAGRGPGGLHGDARPPALAARPRGGRRLPDRPPRRARRPRRLPRPARRRDRWRLGRRGEDPRGRGGPARVVALRRDDGVRRAAPGAAGAHPHSGPRGPGPAVGRRGAGPCEPGRRHHRRQAARRRRRPGGRGGPAHAARPARARRTSTSPRSAAPSRRCSWPWTATAPTSPAAASTPSSRRSSSRRRSGRSGSSRPATSTHWDWSSTSSSAGTSPRRSSTPGRWPTTSGCGSSRPADR